MAFAWFEALKARIEKDRIAAHVANDPVLTAELLLLFRVILADGEVKQRELDIFKRICRESFGLDPDTMDGVYQYMQDFGYETSSEQAAEMFAGLPEARRQMLLDHMIAIASVDSEIDVHEERLVARIADLLGFDVTEIHARR